MSWMRLWCLLLVICLTTTVWGKDGIPVEDFLKSYPSQVFFEENKGQHDSKIFFQAAVSQHQVRFLKTSLSIARFRELHPDDHVKEAGTTKHINFQWTEAPDPEYEGLVWNVGFLNTKSSATPMGKHALPGYANYLRGSDPSKWATRVQRYEELWYEDLYDGIDLRYYGTKDNQLKYDFILHPQSNVRQIVMTWEGIEGLSIDDSGNLIMQTQWGNVMDVAPYAYQWIDGEEVAVNVVYDIQDDHKIGFQIVDSYDDQYPLVIDPLTLTWSSFFHTSTSDDYAMAVCRDALNFVYFTGYTKVLNFPTTPGVYQNSYAGGIDSYLTKLASDGTSMIFSTYLGGTDWELGYGVGINANFEPYVAGFCRSSDFPTTAGSAQPTSNGGLVEGFLTKLSADGTSVLYGTYLGGSDRDYLYDLVVEPSGEAYVTGYTLSGDFPITTGAYAGGPHGNGDVFVSKFNNSGTMMDYSVVIGGMNYDIGNAISVDADGEAFVVGNTGSSDFPVSSGALQTSANFTGLLAEDAFIVKLSADGSSAAYSTYLGGSEGDAIYSIDVNVAEEAFVTGITYSTNFPTTAGVLQSTAVSTSGQGDGFVARLNAAGNGLVYGTYIGGINQDYGKTIRINDSTNEAYVLGATQSSNFPTTAGSNTYVAQHDIFLGLLSANGSSLEYSNLYGGTYNDYPRAASSMYVKDGKITLGVTTHSGDVPMTPGTYQVSKINGVSDAPWIVGIELDIVLPAEFGDFSATWNAEKEAVDLSWFIQEIEETSVQFAIERQASTGLWEEIGQVSSHHESQIYYWEDHAIQSLSGQQISYRIRSQDLGGAEQISSVQTIKLPSIKEARLLVFPNPAQDQIEINYMIPAGSQGRISIVDFMGRTIFQTPTKIGGSTGLTATSNILVSNWPSGVYLLKLNNSDGPSVIKKLVITH